ncbi:acyl-CoA dehydrogenase family protein [Piscinibacter sakaiensis]|uniref:acyl-CoA dehydrogenase family protein n=1 Tax=Piscinibacter sakaiensis TaxID=1547922 RepID=UPI003AAEC005
MLFLNPELTLPTLGRSVEALRQKVRAFVADELSAGRLKPICNSWTEGCSAEFSQRLGERGWIGYHWPRSYGGQGGTAFDTLTINEELLAAGAPVGAHWIAARQSAPLLMRFGSEAQRREFLPAIAAGTQYFAIGMSEPDVGSDLASVRTRAERRAGGWVLNGRKVWTSGAHFCHYIIVLCRTAPADPKARHSGLSQMIVDLRSSGVTIRPIHMLDGNHHFNEVIFDDVIVPDERVVGAAGEGWKQVTSELAYERSGPERFLSTMPLIDLFLRRLAAGPAASGDSAAGRLLARLMTLRNMSLCVWGALGAGQSPVIEAAMVKDLGTNFERESLEIVREALVADERLADDTEIGALLAATLPLAPTYTLRGGTNEVLRNMIAKNLQGK